MASTFSELKFELIGTGDQAGNWGETTNENIGTAIEQAITGLGNPVFTTDANLTISLTDTVALQTARALVLNVTSTGSLTQTRELVVPTIQKQYVVQNNTTGGQSITVKTAGGAGIVVPSGRKMHLYVDGVNVVDMVSTMSSLTLGSPLPITSGGTGQVTRQAAMDALAGAVTAGQYLRGDGTDVVMSAIQAADVPTLNQNTTGTAANVTGTVAVANGGTGATNATTARSNLSAAASGANTDITSVALTTGTISAAPVNNTDIVNKQYADAIASGIHFHEAVDLATTAALPANTYNNGTSGVGATLTANANGALSVDSTLTVVGNRILVKNQAAGAQNGVYVVTQVGSAGAPYILTRATDFDSVGTGVGQIDEGDFFLVTSGTANVNTAWVQQTPPPITIGTTAIVFQQFSAPITYTAGTGLSESPTYTFNIANTGTAGTYGSASSVPVITTNAQGQVTSVTNTTISIPNSSTTATTSNNSNTIVARDAAGNFSAGTISATLSGSATNVTGTVAIANGGTGQTTRQEAMDALAGAVTSGQYLRGNGTDVVMSAIQAADVPTLNQNTTGTAANVTGVVAVANGGTGTATPSLVAGTNITISGSFPNQTINATGGGGGTGDVTGPASSTTNGVALFSSTTGKVLQDSAASDGLIHGLTIGRGTGAISTNTTLGAQALFANSAGTNLVAVGSLALRQNTTGVQNTAVGAQASNANTSGQNNTAVGYTALRQNASGQGNVAVGAFANYFATGANFNTAIGNRALYLAYGSDNVAVGAYALEGANTATESTAVGTSALSQAEGSGSVGVGYNSFFSSTTGTYNTGLGWRTGRSVTTGASNTFVGKSSGELITTGSKNTILGAYNGNQGSLDIRTSDNNIVLSDGDGNPRIRVNSSGNTTLSGTLTATSYTGSGSGLTVDGTNAVGFRTVPQNSQSAAYTLVLEDSGKHIFHPAADNNARTFTIPANSSVAYPIGTALTFINMSVANVTIAITTDTLTLSPAGTTGSRTLATNGSATCIKITATQWLISGSGLT